MTRKPTLRSHMMGGFVVAAIMMVPLAVLSFSYLSKLKLVVNTLVTAHHRQEELGRQYLLTVAGARRAVRSLIFFHDTTYVRDARATASNLYMLADTLNTLFEPEDTTADLVTNLAAQFFVSLDTLAAQLPSTPAKVEQLRQHAGRKLSRYRNELDTLLKEASKEESLDFRDSLLSEVESRLLHLDLDTLLVDLPIKDARIARAENDIDSILLSMASAGSLVVNRARGSIQNDFEIIGITVSRGQRNLLAVLLFSAAALIWWIFYFPRRLQSPILRYVNVLNRAATGDFDQVIPQYDSEEMNRLATALGNLLAYVKRADMHKTHKVRVHWRRLQLLASKSTEFWCIVDSGGSPVLTSSALSGQLPGEEVCSMPPEGFQILGKYPVDPASPEEGFVIWLKKERESP